MGRAHLPRWPSATDSRARAVSLLRKEEKGMRGRGLEPTPRCAATLLPCHCVAHRYSTEHSDKIRRGVPPLLSDETDECRTGNTDDGDATRRCWPLAQVTGDAADGWKRKPPHPGAAWCRARLRGRTGDDARLTSSERRRRGSGMQRQVRGVSVPATIPSSTGQLRLDGDAQKEGGSPTLPWVPRSD